MNFMEENKITIKLCQLNSNGVLRVLGLVTAFLKIN